MSYLGDQEIIPCDRGGLTANPNIDTTSPVQMIHPSRNLNLQKRGRTNRGGTDVYRTFASYDDDFSGTLDNWTIISGSPVISSNKLRVGSNVTSGEVNLVTTLSGDFDIQVKMVVENAGTPDDFANLLGYFVISGTGVDVRVYYKWYYVGAADTWKIGVAGDITQALTSYGAGTIYCRIVRSGTTVSAYRGLTASPTTLVATGTTGAADVTIELYNTGNQSGADEAYVWFDDFLVNEGTFVTTQSKKISSVYDFTKKSGTQYIITSDDSGDVYKNSSNTIATGMSTSNPFSFAMFDDTVYFADGASTPKSWNGTDSTASDITGASDWTGSTQPRQLVVHGRGESQRLWAIMGGTTEFNHCVYASKNGDGGDFSAGNVVKFEIQTDDGYGIVGGVEYGNRLVCFGKRKGYIINDTDDDSANWGYESAQWEGGVAHWRLIVKTPNDVINMMEDGEVYSVTSAENYGDYKAASLTRPAFIHTWIKENIDLSQIDKFHAIYDPNIRAIKYFMVRNGQTQVDMALCFFIDREPQEAWMKHDNIDYDSGYDAACSALVRKSVGDYKIFTGDYSGRVWELETINKNDNSNGYYAGFRTPAINCKNPRSTKNFKRLWSSVKPTGAWDMEVKWWVDGKSLVEDTVDLTPDAGLGSFILGTDVFGGLEVKDVVLDLGQNGRRIQFECYNENANEGFFINQLIIDYRGLGNEPR